MYSLKDKEGTIINNVREDFFKDYDCRKLIGNIDFSVAVPQTGKELFPDIEYLLWAEAKKGALTPSAFHDAFIQLIFTIGRERTFDKNLPPKFLGAFDAEKIAFIPFSAVMEVFSQNDFDWTVAPSDHESKEFKQLKEMVKKALTETGKEKDNVYFFHFFNDKKDLQRFIKRNFVSGRDSVQRMRITYNNFTHIYEKWRKEVMPSIAVNWDNAKKNGLLDADFYLADIMSGDNETLLENLHVLLKSNHYELDRKIDTDGLWASKSVPFNDNMAAHSRFWSKYTRPPKREYWDKIVERRDLLVPQDIRERKGSYFTPRIWVEKSQEYLANVLGEDWQDKYYVWDCCAGTGNLLAGLTNKYNIWASTLDKADVDVMHQRIEEMGDGSNLLKSHVFQFDFLNGDFADLPKGLQEIINDEDKRKRLVIYINPPYKEATNARTVTNTGSNQSGAATTNRTYNKYKDIIGKSIVELFAQFFIRIYKEIPGATLAEFSKLKILQASNFADFRRVFNAKLEKAFIVPANTFDNVTGQFPIGFFIWGNTIEERLPERIIVDVYNSKEELEGTKAIVTADNNYPLITKWITSYRPSNKSDKIIGYERIQGSDFQNNKFTCLVSNSSESHAIFFPIYGGNIIPACVNLSVRLVIDANWLNDRDQFFSPIDNWKYDKDFQNDCIAYTLFHGQNRITSEQGTNHWIPFTPQQVNAPDNFASSFMSDFIAGKLKPQAADTLFGTEESLIPTEPIVFTPAAQAVMEAGRKLWEYYLHKNDKVLYAEPVNVNASFYDIRAHFQGFENGKMRNKSDDEHYNELLRDLRNYQKVLAKQIEKKVYLYGFLKGEVTYNEKELLSENMELKKRIQELEHQHQQSGTITNYGTVNIYER
ncbi:MAG: hypothetical protein J5761_02620 [Paludibacteraceae bacterium]|nr:hypothetical protein [Paludibacteraceae bacterium]